MQHTQAQSPGGIFFYFLFIFLELYDKVRKTSQFYPTDSEDIEEGFFWRNFKRGSQQEISIPGPQVWDAASIGMKLQINVLCLAFLDNCRKRFKPTMHYPSIFSDDLLWLLTQHTVHARESLAMSCVNATVTQHISAGDSFFLFAPCFPFLFLFTSSHSNGCFFSSCTLYNSSIFYIHRQKNYIKNSSNMPIWPRYYRSQLRPEFYPRFLNLHLKF